jgi:carbonic anhydrase
MEIHPVHTDSNGKLAVIACLLQEGKANRALQEIWTRMQIDVFAKLYPHHARPVQPIGTRVVKAAAIKTSSTRKGALWLR